jgi:hypothetical protein
VRARRWGDLDPRARRFIVVAGVIEGVLKIVALIDLARRPSSEVRGSKARWAIAVSSINSLGAVPIAYLVWGRRKSSKQHRQARSGASRQPAESDSGAPRPSTPGSTSPAS